jgi:endonuclease-3
MATRPRSKSPSAAAEGRTAKAARAVKIVERLQAGYSGANCALTHESAFELLVATILSAQCTDERVNMVTKDLFVRFPTPDAFVKSGPGELEDAIRSTGFFNNKAKNIRGACEILVTRFRGEVPRTMEELLLLPGVARKTANVVLGTAFGIRSGFVVDTHVHRLSRRLGLTQHDDPEKIEADLCALLPDADWVFLGHALIWHGRRVCSARAPACQACSLADLCPSNGLPADAWKSPKAAASRPSARGGAPRRAPSRTASSPRGGARRGARRGSGSSRPRSE